MGERVLLAAVLSVVLAAVPVSPALAQLSGEGPLRRSTRSGGDGNLTIGGDVVVPCSKITNPYTAAEDTLEERRAAEEAARACEAAGFGGAAGPSSGGTPTTPAASASVLPGTGGPAATWPHSSRWPRW